MFPNAFPMAFPSFLPSTLPGRRAVSPGVGGSLALCTLVFGHFPNGKSTRHGESISFFGEFLESQEQAFLEIIKMGRELEAFSLWYVVMIT